MIKRCIIISGGEYSPILCAEEKDYVVACDKGYAYAVQNGIVPDLFVGDCDSYKGEIDSNVTVQKYQKEKDDTDTMIAVRYAMQHEYDEIDIYCALGGRLDHTYANIQSAVLAAKNGVFVKIFGVNEIIYFLTHGNMTIPEKPGFSLSLFSVTDRCINVNINGVKYPLLDAELTNTYPIGVSNEWNSESAHISVGEGILMILLSKLN